MNDCCKLWNGIISLPCTCPHCKKEHFGQATKDFKFCPKCGSLLPKRWKPEYCKIPNCPCGGQAIINHDEIGRPNE